MRLYVNGVLTVADNPAVVAAWNTTGAISVDPTVGPTTPFTYGAHPSYQVAELAIYRFALAQDRIRTHWLSSNYGQLAAAADPYATEVNADSPLLWLRLQETDANNLTVTNSGSLSSAANGTRTSNPLKPVGSPIPTVGAGPSPTRSGATSYLFDGTAGMVAVPISATQNQALIPATSGATQDATKALTAEAWIYLLTAPNATTYYAVSGIYDGTNYNWVFQIYGPRLCFYPGFNKVQCATNVISPGQWYHIAATYSGANTANATGDTRLYINGVAQPYDISSTVAIAPKAVAAGTVLGVGGVSTTSYEHFPGYISEVAFYGSALSAQRINAHYNASLVAQNPTVLATPGNRSVTLSWAPPAISGGTPPVGYKIYRCTGSISCTPTVLVANTNSTSTTYQDLSVTNGTNYVYTVAALNTNNNSTQEGPSSAAVAATPGNTPGPPPTLSAVPGSSNMNLSWTAPSAVSPSVIGYEYSYSDASGVFSTPTLLNSTTTTFNQTNLTAGATYTFRVRAFNGLGYGPYATIQSGPLSGVTGLTGTSGDSSVLLTWRPPASTGGMPVNGYKILYSTTSAGLLSSPITASANTGSNATNYQVTGLLNGTPYFFSVSPILGAASPFTEGPVATTSATPNAGPNPPVNLVVTPGNAAVTLTWSPSSSNVFTINGYYVDYSADNGITYVPGSPSLIPFGTNNALVGVGGVGNTALINGQSYLFRVRVVYTSNTNLTVGAASTVTGSPLSGASRPTNLTASATAPGTVTLAWVAPSGATGLNTQAYQIQSRISTDTASVWSNLVANTGSQRTTITVDGLTPGALYEFRVSAITAQFNSAASDTATATILGAPNLPANLAAVPGDSIVQLSWQPPTPSPGVTVTGYQVDYSINSVDWTPLVTADAVTFRATAYGLTNGVQYFFRIQALSTAGAGNFAYVNVVPAALASAPVSYTHLTLPTKRIV